MQFDFGEFKIWLEYGILGLIILAFLRGWVVPRWVYAERVSENERLKNEIEAQTDINLELAQAFTRLSEGLRRMTE
jgi:O-antigen ligase